MISELFPKPTSLKGIHIHFITIFEDFLLDDKLFILILTALGDLSLH